MTPELIHPLKDKEANSNTGTVQLINMMSLLTPVN